MPTEITIKQDLFRFATLRAPEQLSDVSKPLNFVTHPNISASYLLDGSVIGLGLPVT